VIKAVLFDFGGVLSPGGKSIAIVFSRLLGIPVEQVEIGDLHLAYRQGAISTDDFFAQLNAEYGKDITAQKFTEASDIFVHNKEVYDLAKKLRAKGLKTGIFSNIYELSANSLKAGGFYEGFDPLILSHQENLAKPNKEFYELAVKRLDVKPQEILFIDDQEKCLPPARDLGMHVIKADNQQQIVADIKTVLKRENNLVL
jgi:epoxide hydrolase-like predicted phosphatase